MLLVVWEMAAQLAALCWLLGQQLLLALQAPAAAVEVQVVLWLLFLWSSQSNFQEWLEVMLQVLLLLLAHQVGRAQCLAACTASTTGSCAHSCCQEDRSQQRSMGHQHKACWLRSCWHHHIEPRGTDR